MAKRKFLFNLSLLIFLNLLIKPLYILGIDTEFIVRLGQSTYGNYFALLNLSFLLNIFLDFGIVNFNTSNIARHEQLITKHFSNIVVLRFVLSLAYILITLVGAFVIGYTGYNLYLLLILCLNQILAGFIMYLRSNLAGMQLFAQDSVMSVMDRLLLVVLCALALWGGVFGETVSIELFIFLQTASYALAVIVGLAMVLRQTGKVKAKWNMPFSFLILKKSFPYALLILLMGFYYRVDGIMLERMLDNGAYEAGIYAQAFRFFEAGNMMAYLFSVILFPMFSRMLKQNESITELLNVSFRILSFVAISAGMIGAFYSVQIMDIRYDSEIIPAANAFQYLMIGFMGVSGTYVFGALLTANGNLRSLNIMAIVGVVINVVLNALLIPRLMAEGAAIASMVTQLVLSIAQIALVKRYLGKSIDINIWMRFIFFIALSIVVIVFFKYSQFSWFKQVIFYMIIAGFLGVVFKLFSLNAIKEMILSSRVVPVDSESEGK